MIEAIVEDLPTKQELFARLEQLTLPEAILASNTSVIPVGHIAAAMHSAQRMLGTHWWNPPYLVPLVEVIQAGQTTPEAVERMMTLAGDIPLDVDGALPHVRQLRARCGLAVVLAFMPYFASDYDVIVGYQVLQLAALAQAWNLIAGYGGLVSLATAAFIGIGPYTTTDPSSANATDLPTRQHGEAPSPDAARRGDSGTHDVLPNSPWGRRARMIKNAANPMKSR